MQEIVSIIARPKERIISAKYIGHENHLRTSLDRNQYKVAVYRTLEELFSSGTKSGKRTFCSVSSGGETQEFRGKLNLTGKGWEISGDGRFKHSSFDVFGSLVSEDTDNVYMEVYPH